MGTSFAPSIMQNNPKKLCLEIKNSHINLGNCREGNKPLLGPFPPARYLWFIMEKGLGRLLGAAPCSRAAWGKQNHPQHAQQGEAAAANNLPVTLAHCPLK